jgi:1,4-dihydroxy-2-naphthoate octaprenyltransferase
MATAKSWIKAARPRTLPLALSGIIMGCGLALFYGAINTMVSVLAIITATLIQIFSNFTNDYGDSQKGTDNENRVGPTRTLQSGEISQIEMKKGMFLVGALSFLSGVWLVYLGTWHHSKIASFAFIGLGILSLIAAYFYTAGKKSYGYIGLGDIAVFLFFGLLPVIGVFYLNSGFLNAEVVLPALSLGFFSTGVLNLNNMRDIENDEQFGKITIPVRLGEKKSLLYHNLIIILGWITGFGFTLLQNHSNWQFIYLITLPFFAFDLIKINKIRVAQELDPFLKRLALSILAFTLLFCVGLILASS